MSLKIYMTKIGVFIVSYYNGFLMMDDNVVGKRHIQQPNTIRNVDDF